MSEQKDVKLKEAERTIANKDVIIKMLQDQVKKLEDCYKKNMNETEAFRYKYCLASEQIRRLRGNCFAKCPKRQCREIKQDSPIVCEQMIKEKCIPPPNKCSYFQQLRNVENVMKEHYQLLETIVEKIADKKVTPKESRTLVDENELKMLQQEVERLKCQNAELTEKLNSPEIVEEIPEGIPARDSLLDNYRRSNQHLHEKIDSLTEGVSSLKEDGSVDEDLILRRAVSFGHVDVLPQIAESACTVDPPSPSKEEELYCFPEEKSETPIKSDDNNSTNEVLVKIEDKIETPIISDDNNKCSIKLTLVKINEVLDKQTSIFDNLSSMKENLANSLQTTQAFTENIFNVMGTMNEQNGMFYNDFQEHKVVGETMARECTDLNQQVRNIHTKIEEICQMLSSQKQNEGRRSSRQKTTPKVSQLKSTEKDLKNLEEKYECMQQQNVQMDRKITCMNALISYYKNLQMECSSACQGKPCEDKVNDYLDSVKNENIKIKTTISSVIGELNEKMSELKYTEPNQDVASTNGATCSYYKKSSLVNPDDTSTSSKRDSNPELDIQDVYNAVRRTVLQDGGCISEMCVCSQSENLKSDCQDTKDVNDEEGKCCTESIASNLQSYITYLHEQLGVITDIEDHIDNMRKDVN